MTYNDGIVGPTLRVHSGDTLRVTVVNQMDQATSLHTHGLHIAPGQDNPFVTIQPGTKYTYTYTIARDQQAGTYWYHPHVHGITAEQVAAGLSGAIIVENEDDQGLDQVTTDHVLVLNDPPLTQSNPWTGNGSSTGTSGMSGMTGMDGMSGMSGMQGMGGASGVDMMTVMMGRTGPRILTNGQDGVTLPADGRLERVHVVNATASTRMRLSFTGSQMVQLATPGGRVASPRRVEAIELAPGERTELALLPGADGGMLTATRMSNEGNGGPTGVPEPVANVSPSAGRDASVLPSVLLSDTRDLFAPDVKIAKQRTITLYGHMHPTIDGRPFDPNRVNFTARKGTVEEWVIKNTTPMWHPIHLHAWPFQVKGISGMQDIVTVPPNSERVIRVTYDDFGGKTVIHCHILDHEDTGMMAIINVV